MTKIIMLIIAYFAIGMITAMSLILVGYFAFDIINLLVK